MSSKSAHKRLARRNAMRYTLSDTSPYRDSIYAAKRNWGSGKSNDKVS